MATLLEPQCSDPNSAAVGRALTAVHLPSMSGTPSILTFGSERKTKAPPITTWSEAVVAMRHGRLFPIQKSGTILVLESDCIWRVDVRLLHTLAFGN